MPHVLTAREARDRFGEVLRRAETNGETFIVERKGRPSVVIMSAEEYDRLTGQHAVDYEKTLEDIFVLNRRILARRGGDPIPPPEEVLKQAREERDAQILGLRGR
ncbi:MAG: type II toxin-antitoxin system Phd/YefM family antitoxin [Desulfacinum sp.]|nr:type II toxin-antitoxin system Phd/YefM family antitoxin [Desulfacinum sp.]